MQTVTAPENRFSPARPDKLPVPLRLSAMIGATLLLWTAILVPFIA